MRCVRVNSPADGVTLCRAASWAFRGAFRRRACERVRPAMSPWQYLYSLTVRSKALMATVEYLPYNMIEGSWKR